MYRFLPKSRLTVKTKSGHLLGRVVSVEIDTDTGRIQNFFVSTSRVLPVVLDKELAIAWSQVVAWNDSELIVSDAYTKAGVTNLVMASSPSNEFGSAPIFKEDE